MFTVITSLINRYLRHRREVRCLKKCGNVTYCPKCREILTDRGLVLDDFSGVITMQCPCGKNSRWLFDAPCPVLLPESPAMTSTGEETGE